MDITAYISTPDRMEELQAQNERLQGERSGFENTIKALRDSLDAERRRVTSLESRIDSLIEHLVHYAEIGNIESDVAEDLAGIFDRDLTRTVDVRMTIVLDAQVSVPVGYDLDDLHGDVDVEVNPIYAADVQIEGIEVSTIDVES
jgi:hypothetical protein